MQILYIAEKKGKIKTVNIEETLDELRRVLNVERVEYTYRFIDGVGYCIVCDEEGLLVNDPLISAVNTNKEVSLVGNFIIRSKYINGVETRLDIADVDRVLEHTKYIVTERHPEPRLVVEFQA